MSGDVSYGNAHPVLTAIPNSPVLLPTAVDHRSHHDADRVAISYPAPGTVRYVDVTWAQFGHSVDDAACVFDEKIGARRSSSAPVKTVAILARSDAAYMVSIYALHKCGIVPLLLSTRNSKAAIQNLLQLTNSVAILTDSYHRAEAEAAASQSGFIPVFDVAPLPGSTSGKRRPFPFNLTWEGDCDRPDLILHTSGSTGLPKPVAWNTRFFWHQGYFPPSFTSKYNGSSVLATLPLFHGSGVGYMRALLLWAGCRIIFPDPSKPVTASAIMELCRNRTVAPDIVMGAPSVIEEIPTLPGGMNVMRGRKFWIFVGAPVPPHFGDQLVRDGVRFIPMLGSTEIGQMNVPEPEGRLPEDWNYHEIRPDLDIVLEPSFSTPDSGTYELIVLAKEGWKPAIINVNINGVDGYATSDLYQKHPTHPRLLKHSGRADDVVVLSNGEKTLSRAIEVSIEADPHVSSAIVFGTGRMQNGVLIAPAAGFAFDPKDKEKLAEFRNAIWLSVERANATSPSHSRIWKEMLLVTTQGKDLPRTDKGSVKRKFAIEIYAKEIDELYLEIESLASKHLVHLPDMVDMANLVLFFRGLIKEAMWKSLNADEDVFENGMDSLKAIYVRNSLLSALKRDHRMKDLVTRVPRNFVFLHTSAQAMADATSRLVASGYCEQETAERHANMIDDMVRRYTESFPVHEPKDHLVNGHVGEVVVLTGSTGSLGTFLLNSLLKNPNVEKVFAFNRHGSSPSANRQLSSYKERGLDVTSLSIAISAGRLVYYEVEVHQPNFGLPSDAYEIIRSSTTLIIHNAWAVNFNWSLATFEPTHIRGLRNLIDFALSSPRASPPRIAFTSSIATAGAHTSGPVPEEPIEDPAVCLTHGYARSKFVGERILTIAAEKAGLQTLSFRIGTISGDTVNGTWNSSDHIPALIKGCQELGAIPADWPSAVTWVPVDTVAQTIVDVCLDQKRGAGMLNISNPRPTPWTELSAVVQQDLTTNDGRPLELIKMRDWVNRLTDSKQSAELNPAVKLIEYFETHLSGNGIRCRLGLDKTMELSSGLKELPPVDEKSLRLYLSHWKKVQFLCSRPFTHS